MKVAHSALEESTQFSFDEKYLLSVYCPTANETSEAFCSISTTDDDIQRCLPELCPVDSGRCLGKNKGRVECSKL